MTAKFVMRAGLFVSHPHPVLKSRVLLQGELRQAALEAGTRLTPDDVLLCLRCLREGMGVILTSGTQVELL